MRRFTHFAPRLAASAPISFTRAYCIGTPNAPVKDFTAEEMWNLWNEGNLFSLTLPELSQFLEKNRMRVDSKMKKAALVRQVEEFLQSREAQTKGKGSGDGDKYGQWDQASGSKPDVLLDLSQSGFYEGSTQGAPRAFQLLMSSACPDLTIARVNTTAFPGFPANSECFSLTGSDADLSAQVRYTKTLQWCMMNLRNLGLDGEVCVEFGKLVLKPEVVRKNRKVLSSWTLQQRLQATNPHHWVATVADKAEPDVLAVLKKFGFGESSAKVVNHEVVIRRAQDTLNVDLSAKMATLAVHKKADHLQQAYIIRDHGCDIRLLVRTRAPLKKSDTDLFMKTPILKSDDDEVSSILPVEHGEVSYAAEVEQRRWEKKFGDMSMIVTETLRQPLIISRDEDEGDRREYAVSIKIPSQKDLDLATLGNDVLHLAKAIAEAASPSFQAEYKLKPEAVASA